MIVIENILLNKSKIVLDQLCEYLNNISKNNENIHESIKILLEDICKNMNTEDLGAGIQRHFTRALVVQRAFEWRKLGEPFKRIFSSLRRGPICSPLAYNGCNPTTVLLVTFIDAGFCCNAPHDCLGKS